MISVAEAKKLILQNIVTLDSVDADLLSASGMVLSENVYASTDIPSFPQSAMDGYALSFNGWKTYRTLKIEGEIAAGDGESAILGEEKAIRIFTGAAVPPGADTVVMQEKVKTVNSGLIIEDENLKPGSNVRPRGSEIKAGAVALVKGTYLSSAAIGFLAGIGITKVKVYARPRTTILVTGNELQQPGRPLQYGQVYESNSYSLRDALQHLNINDVKLRRVRDDLEQLIENLKIALEESDVVLLTGGVSAGDYDFVPEAALRCGVKAVFHKVKQRPGKPFYFGTMEGKLVFGLPGNPSSVLSCFYEYVVQALDRLSNREISLKVLQVPLAKAFKKTALLTHFLKGFYDGSTALPLEAQESYRMSTYAHANCLIRIDEDLMECKEGDMVEIHLFPY